MMKRPPFNLRAVANADRVDVVRGQVLTALVEHYGLPLPRAINAAAVEAMTQYVQEASIGPDRQCSREGQ